MRSAISTNLRWPLIAAILSISSASLNGQQISYFGPRISPPRSESPLFFQASGPFLSELNEFPGVGALAQQARNPPNAEAEQLPFPDGAIENRSGEATTRLLDGSVDHDHDDPYETDDVSGDYPALPPDPYAEEMEQLDAVEAELWQHGGSYLYAPEGDRLNWPSGDDSHYDLLRLPESWQEPRPWTAFADFLGADPIRSGRRREFGGYSLEPRFVGYGEHTLFGFALEQDERRQDVIGNQLRLELDLRLTGTERFHVQFRPLGERDTGGSFYQFSDPDGYVNNSTSEPERYWFEGELHSFLGFDHDPLAKHYTNFMLGKFPFILHNTLLMNDEIIGAVVSQNNIQLSGLSNLNLQWFVGANDVDTYRFVESQVYGINGTADFKQTLYETTYAYVNAEQGRSTHFFGLSRTKFYGPLTIAVRGLFKLGDVGGSGSSQLVTIESNYTRAFDGQPLGFHHGVFFCNAFWAGQGWNSIAGTNLNRLRTAFEVNPLVRLSAAPALQDTLGVTMGVQLFRCHEDESLVPEFAWESPGGDAVFGLGLRYLRKTGCRTFVEMLGVKNWSDVPEFDREGIFLSHTYLF